MTAFERFFASLKLVLGRDDIYGIWPDFEPEFDEREHAWTDLRGLGETLLLNCGQCDGPSDMKHERCRGCTDRRRETAKKTYTKTTGRQKGKWPTIILCRIHTK